MAKASLTAEVSYRTDEASARRAQDDGKRMVAKWQQDMQRAATIPIASSQGLASQMAGLRGQTLSGGAPIEAMAAQMRTAIMRNVSAPMAMQAVKLKKMDPFLDPAFIDRSGVKLTELNETLAKTGNGLGAVRGASTNAGMGMLMLSQTIDDMQYGLRGWLNNISPLVMALGGSTGLAGVLTIGAVAVNQMSGKIDEWIGSAQNATEIAKGLADMQDWLAKSTAASSAAGAELGQNMMKQFEGHEQARAQMGREVARKNEIISKDEELASVQADRLQGAERMAAQQKAARESEEKKLLTSLELAEKGLAIDSKRAKELESFVASEEHELETLKKKGEEFEKQKKAYEGRYPGMMVQYTKDLAASVAAGDSAPVMPQKGYNERPAADVTRQAFLQGRADSNREAAAAFRKRAEEGEQNVADLKNRMGPVADRQKKIDNEKLVQEKVRAANEAIIKSVGAVMELLENMEQTATLANARAVELWKRQKAAAANQDALLREKRDLHNSEIKNPRQRERAERAASIDDETRRLLNQYPDMKPADAASMAERKQRVAERSRGVRKIRRGPDGRLVSSADGIDGDTSSALDGDPFKQRGLRPPTPSALDNNPFAPRGFRPETPNLDDPRKPKPRDKAPAPPDNNAKPPADKVVSSITRMETTLGSKLDRLIDATKTPAEKAKPIN